MVENTEKYRTRSSTENTRYWNIAKVGPIDYILQNTSLTVCADDLYFYVPVTGRTVM